MYKFSVLNNNLGISTFYHSVNDNAFLIIVEDINWHFSQAKDNFGLEKTLQKAFCMIQDDATIDNIPMEFAKKIDFILKKLNMEKTSRDSLYFTGVSLTKNKVYACTSGYTRVHLLQNTRIMGKTRDHNIASDKENNKVLDVTFEEFPSFFYSHTRTLGIEESNPPESLSWDIEGNYTVLVCSATYHQFGNPEKYIESLTPIENINIIRNSRRPSGIVATIEYIKPCYEVVE